MTVKEVNNVTTVTLENFPETQVIYNALHEYMRAYNRRYQEPDFNANHAELIEKMAEIYHNEYVKDVVNVNQQEDYKDYTPNN